MVSLLNSARTLLIILTTSTTLCHVAFANEKSLTPRRTKQAIVSDASLAKNKSVSRTIEISEVSHLGDNRLRIIFNAQERDGSLRFPITTIDRSMVKVEFTNVSSAPADPKSLLLHGMGGAEVRRALYVGFGMHRHLPQASIAELKTQIGDLIKSLPADYLTVAAIAQDSARVIADVTPENGDNINRIIQQLQNLDAEGEGPALTNTLCVAAERFHAWGLNHFKKGDQKALIVLSSPGDAPSTERYRTENCWRSLIDQGVRVFIVTFGKGFGRDPAELSPVALESGGHYHRVNGMSDMYAAVKNVMAILHNEYVIDVDAPDIPIEDQPLDLKLKISYHDEVFESQNFGVGFVIPDLSRVFANRDFGQSQSDEGSSDRGDDWSLWLVALFVLPILLFLMLIGFLVSKILRSRMDSVLCSTCAVRVKRDHSDCPFRKSEAIARLVVIGGKNAGQTIPIMKGETSIGRFPKSGARIKGKNISWFNHGTIRIDGQKALYSPRKSGRDRINGWIVHEPRLLGVGSLLSIGDQKLRLEVKPSVHT